MCPSNTAAAVASRAQEDATSNLDWHLEENSNVCQLVIKASVRPEIELNSCEVRVQFPGQDMHILQMPVEAQPVGVDEALCKYSKRRAELIVTWPRLAFEANSAAPAAADVAVDEAKQDLVGSPPEKESAGEAADVRHEVPTSAMEAPQDEQSKAEAVERVELGALPKEPTSDEESCMPAAADAVSQSVETPASAAHNAEEWKALGNEAVASGDLDLALERYTHGLDQEPNHAMLFSNRALCFHRLGRLEEALTDAQRCASLRPDFMKGFLRAGLVLRELQRPVEAMEMLRRAPKHDEIEKLSAQLRPEAEAAEAKRIAGLTGAERKKEEGNALFKKGLFEQALVLYDKALALCVAGKDEAGTEALEVAVRNNRAACQHQLSNFSAVLEDTSKVLEKEPDNLKALVRRMLALEPLEKYEAALEDARKVLRFCPGHEVANRIQHRLGKLVRDNQRQQAAAAA